MQDRRKFSLDQDGSHDQLCGQSCGPIKKDKRRGFLVNQVLVRARDWAARGQLWEGGFWYTRKAYKGNNCYWGNRSCGRKTKTKRLPSGRLVLHLVNCVLRAGVYTHDVVFTWRSENIFGQSVLFLTMWDSGRQGKIPLLAEPLSHQSNPLVFLFLSIKW